MRRRDFLKTLSTGAAFLALGGNSLLAKKAKADRPNIMVILSDDLGFSDLGCYGGEIETPNLDALAAGGVRFTEFYGNARCWPTRATLMSGRYSDKLENKQVSIPEVLKPVGYQSAMVGKWNLERNPIQRGFDDFYGTIMGAGSYWNPRSLTRGEKEIKPDRKDYYYTEALGAEAVRQIEDFAKAKERPFFQYVAFTCPHWPLHAREEVTRKYLERYKIGWTRLRLQRYAKMLKMGIIDEQRWPLPAKEPRVQDFDKIAQKAWRIRNMAVYAAMVDHMDQAIGKIVDALKRNKLLDNTLIIFTNDNGACPEHLHPKGDAWGTARNVMDQAKALGKPYSMGDNMDVPSGGRFTFHSVGHNWANSQNTPLRRYKMNVHEGGACVPCIMHWPKGLKLKPGSITTQRGHMVDIQATSMELAGAEYPREFNGNTIRPNEGRSLVGVLMGEKLKHEHPYYFNHMGTQAVIKGDWKVIREGRRKWELHNITKEKTEITNLADKMPEKVKQLVDLFGARYPE